MKRSEIEKFAQMTLAQHGLTSIPVDPVMLASRLGIKVNHATFTEDNISGLIAKRDDSAMILVNSNDVPLRKRFTIAHEIGHYLMHLKEATGEMVDRDLDLFRTDGENESNDSRLKEIQANQFAAALLMPADKIREALAESKSIEDLAYLFKVSVEAMGYRINTLGL